jgi:hypothetical protein
MAASLSPFRKERERIGHPALLSFKQGGLLMRARFLVAMLVTSQVWAQNVPGKAAEAKTTIEQIKESVVFLQTHWSESNVPSTHTDDCDPSKGHKCEVGTGFLIFKELPELGKDQNGDGVGVDYLVTAKHMIRQVKIDHQPGPYAQYSTVRLNTVKPVDATGKSWVTVDADILDARGDFDWFTDTSDPIADVALTPINLNETLEYKTTPISTFATKNVIKELHVNENDEVFFAGLFINYFGALKNYPIVRHGKLALLTDEQIEIDPTAPSKKTDIFLAEVTSFGGNSGSPVFLRIGPLREGLDINMRLGYQYYLLGVMKGFVSDQEAKQNAGIAAIVPADKIADILASDKIRAFEARFVAHFLANRGDFKAAESKFQESISILERVAPEGSQLAATLRDFAAMLQKAKRPEDSKKVLAKADNIASKPISAAPQP